MMLTQTKLTLILDKRLAQSHQDIENLEASVTQLKIKYHELTQLFNQASAAIGIISELTALLPQTSTEICAALESIFQFEHCSIVDAKPLQEVKQLSPTHPLIQVANQLVPFLKQEETITNTVISRLMTEPSGGSDAEGYWLWKDAYEALEAAQVMLIQKQGQELFNKFDHSKALEEIERIHRLCLTHTRRSETSIQLQQFSTPLPLSYIASIAAQITPDDLVLEPSAGTGILASFAHISGAQLLLNEICPKRRGILSELFPNTPVSGFNAEQIDDYLNPEYRPTVVVMNPPFSASPKMAKRNQFATLKHLNSALFRLLDGGRLVAITANWFSPLNYEWCESFIKLQHSAKVVFSGGIEGHVYAKHGTTIETRLTVFDKSPSDNLGVFDNCFDATFSLSDLLKYVKIFMPERQTPTDTPLAGVKEKALTERTAIAIAINHPSKDVLIQHKTNQLQSKSEHQKAPRVKNFCTGDVIELPYTIRDWNGNNHEISDALYETYEPQTLLIEGATEHPSSLVQSAAMASVAPPKPSYKPRLPKRLINDGILSSAQLESVIYAGESHSKFLKGNYQIDDTLDIVSVAPEDAQQAVQFRRGYFIGDSTGVGKGRQVSAIILDNYLQGRKKALWISKSDTLLEDARRDWKALGGNPDQIVSLSHFRQGEPIELTEGIIFATYATLRTEAKQGKKSRVEQLIDWCGKDFQGVIVFDEAHAMSNASSEKGKRGMKKPSLQGVAGLRLQNGLPNARVLYVSATGATTINNLAYAQRLGLWMSGEFPFASQADFVAQMEKGGIAALEVVSRDLKALGLYTARSLSYEGVEYDILEHQLTEGQIAIYNAYADAFQVIHQNLEAALEATNITSPNGKTRNRNAKSAARSAFESNKQRFFNHLITSMKCPTLIKSIEQDFSNGHAIILQIISTDEALLDRRLADIPTSEWNDLQIDITPREYVMDYLMHSFPVQLHEVYTDEEGNEYSRPVTDSEGKPVFCSKALRQRENLIERLGLLPAVPGALDQVVQHFGYENVAEVTGRSKRIVRETKGGRERLALQKRSGSANLAETQAFMDDKKRILIFSELEFRLNNSRNCLS